MRKTRVRFAPSPTGPLHIGGVRTALYNYLYAKQNGGDFILRIEDTDSQRFVPGAEEYIVESLAWCGITPDKGLDSSGKVDSNYRQSNRKPIYRKYANELIERGFAYYAFDTPEELAAKRAEAEAKKETFIYNYLNRNSLRNSLTLSKEESQRLVENSSDWTIRFKMPENQIVKMHDIIRGDIEVNTNTLDDKVLWKASDGLPTYHLANIVDDHLMEITEVIRGAEWLPSLPLHYMLYKAFGWEDTMPRFAHLSLLLKPDGKGKLSKRDGDKLGFPVFPLEWINPESKEVTRGYREDGYYPEAFINLLALLGWNPGTEQEIFSLDELVSAFSLERVIKSGARFNPEKAKWFNEQYLRLKTPRELAIEFKPMVAKELQNFGEYNPSSLKESFLQEVCALIKERAHFSKEFWGISKALFAAPSAYEEADVKKFCTIENRPNIEEILTLLKGSALKGYGSGAAKEEACAKIEELLMGRISERGWKTGQIMNTLRLYFTGNTKGLGISDIIYFIGIDEACLRIEKGLKATY